MLATRRLVDSFYQYAVHELHNGGAALTTDELYDRWRARQDQVMTSAIRADSNDVERGVRLTINETRSLLENDVRAVTASLRDMTDGDAGQAFADFDREFRRSRGWADTRNSNSSKR